MRGPIRHFFALLTVLTAAALFAAEARAQTAASDPAKPVSQLAPDPRLQKPDAPPPPGSTATATQDDSDGTPAAAGKKPDQPNIVIQREKGAFDDDDDADILELIASLPDGVQKDIMDEAATAKTYCEHASFLNSFYDCSCYSLRMAAERVKKGPDVAFFALEDQAKFKKCISMPKIAGYGLDWCTKSLMGSKATTKQLTDICDCTARSLAHSYEKKPYPSTVYVNNLFMEILGFCRQQSGF